MNDQLKDKQPDVGFLIAQLQEAKNRESYYEVRTAQLRKELNDARATIAALEPEETTSDSESQGSGGG